MAHFSRKGVFTEYFKVYLEKITVFARSDCRFGLTVDFSLVEVQSERQPISIELSR